MLDCLAGRSPKGLRVTGDIRINGSPAPMTFGSVAYVPQSDLFTGTLTVRETLAYTSRLRFAPQPLRLLMLTRGETIPGPIPPSSLGPRDVTRTGIARGAAGRRLDLTREERAASIAAVMAELGLSSAADTPVGTTLLKGISGGQKRRLSIAAEMLVQPKLLFLDEPTSGAAPAHCKADWTPPGSRSATGRRRRPRSP